jgi:phosphate transport system permease protein
MVAASPPVSHLSDGQRAPGLVADRVFRTVALVAGLSVLVILGLIAFSTTQQAWPAFAHQGLSYFTAKTWDPPHNKFGTLTFVWGTLVVAAIALFITEIAPRATRRWIVYVVDLLAAVPSVVYGLWGFIVLAPKLTGFYVDVSNWTKPIPLVGTMLSGNPVTGLSFMTAGLVVALMITPIITSITREVFATVPAAQKEAAVALGATRWEMIRGAVFPHSRSGIVGGVLIGLGRAMGETIAVAMVIGSATSLTGRLLSPGNTMAAAIASQFGEATGDYRAALIGLGVVLFVLTILIGVIARAFVARVEARSQGL